MGKNESFELATIKVHRIPAVNLMLTFQTSQQITQLYLFRHTVFFLNLNAPYFHLPKKNHQSGEGGQ